MQIKQTRQILLTNLSLVALFGWLLIVGMLTLSTNASNEDSVALLYLVMLPLSTSAGCAAVWWLCAQRGLMFTTQQRVRSLLLAPIVYVLAERGTVYGVFARQHIDLSTVAGIVLPATCWLLAVTVGCYTAFPTRPTASIARKS